MIHSRAQTRLILILLFLICSGVFYILISARYNNQQERYLQLVSEKYEHAYNTIYEQHKQMAETLYTGITKRYKIAELYEQLQTADENRKNELRQELLEKTLPRYEELKSVYLRQLHFHTADNHSFLRLHRPEKYGDDLTEIRGTVKYVNKYHTAIDGFESGRIFDGYRFVFPITGNDGDHLGSMEISFAPAALTTAMMKQYMVLSNFFIKEDVINRLVFRDEALNNYKPSHHEGYLYDKEVLAELKNIARKEMKGLKPSEETTQKVYENAHKGRAVSFSDLDISAVFTTIPVYSPTNRLMNAFFTVRSYDQHIVSAAKDFQNILILGIGLLGLTFLIFYLLYSKRITFEENSELLRKQQKALRDSEIKFRCVFEKAGTGIARVNTDGMIQELNSTFCEIVGHSKKDMAGRHYTEITHPEDVEKSVKLFSTALQGSFDTYKTDKRYIKENGETVWVDLVVTLARKTDGSPDYFIAGIQDITKRVIYQKQLAGYQSELEQINKNLEQMVQTETRNRMEQAVMFKQMFNSLNLCVYVFDTNYKYLIANTKYLENTGLSEKNITSSYIMDIQGQSEFRKLVPMAEQVFKGSTVSRNVEMNDPEGGTIHVEETFTPFREANGEISGAIVISADITEQTAMKDELNKKEHLMIQQSKLADMGSMIGAIAHQWQQPLNILSLSMGLYQETHEEDAEAQELAETVFSQIEFMAQTVNDFRNFYSPSKRKHYFNLTEAMNKVLTMFRKKLETDRLNVQITGEQTVNAYGFRNEFMQVVMNIINNAKDAINENGIKGGCITIDIKQDGGKSVVTFADNGGGIPEKLLPEKLFEQFVTSKGENGTGIGLSMSKTIIEKYMGGTLKAENSGSGALFTVELPSGEENTAVEDINEVSILYVEDDEFTARSTSRILNKYYKNIYTASNGKEGLETFIENSSEISAVITDLDMPVMNGIDMSREIRKISPEIPIIVTSAIKPDIFEDIGFNGIFEKPIHLRELNQKLNNILLGT